MMGSLSLDPPGADLNAPTSGTGPQAPRGSTSNLPFDVRYHAPNPFAGPLFRGNIQRRDNPNRRMFFLFNPNQISVGYGAMQGMYNSALVDQAAQAQSLTVSLTTWGFSLLFDRHYEVTYGRDTQGVLRDLDAFEAMVGFSAAEKHMGVIDWTAYDWFLGEQFQFFGRISSCQVSLTLFNHNMIPMQMEMQIAGEGMFGNLTTQPTVTSQTTVPAPASAGKVTPTTKTSTKVAAGVTRVGGSTLFPS